MSTALKQQGCLSTLVCVDNLAQGSNRARGYHVALLLMQDLQRIVRCGAEPYGRVIKEAEKEGA